MAQKSLVSKGSFMDSVKESVTSVFDMLFLSFRTTISREADLMFDKFEERTLAMQQRLLWNVAGAIVIGLSSVFLVTSVYFYLIEFQQISRTTSFLILAIVLFIAGFYIKKTRGGAHYGKKQ